MPRARQPGSGCGAAADHREAPRPASAGRSACPDRRRSAGAGLLLPLLQPLEEAERDLLEKLTDLRVPRDPPPDPLLPLRRDVEHAVFAVEAEAQIQRAMARLGFAVASAGFLAARTAHLDEIAADEAGLFEQQSQPRVLGSLVLGQGGSRQHSGPPSLIYY